MLSDELSVRLMELACKLLLDPEAEQGRLAWAHQTIERIETSIRARAARVATERYERHLAHCAKVWAGRSREPYVPALLADEYDGWDKPDVMRRRFALRARLDVRSIMEGVTT